MTIPSTVLGRYAVEKMLGKGGMGAVYRGRHLTLNFPVAIKVILREASPGLHARFIREAELMARVDHPNVVRIHDFGVVGDNMPCIVMDFVDGIGLDEYLERRGWLPVRDALKIIDEILAGLEAIHAEGIVHRDLKEANVVLASVNDGYVARILDFGVAKPSDSLYKLTKTGVMVGTPHYMAPEQLDGTKEIDGRADIYALGTLLYEMVSGSPPFHIESQAAVFRRVLADPPRLKTNGDGNPLPGWLIEAVMRMIARDRDDRFLSATHTRKALQPPKHQLAKITRSQPRPDRSEVSFAETAVDKPAADKPDVPQTWLVAARLPSRALESREARRAVALSLPSGVRGYSLGPEIWFATIPAAAPEIQEQRVSQIREVLTDNVGRVMRFEHGTAGSPDFVIPATALSGAAPLPKPLQRLVSRILARN